MAVETATQVEIYTKFESFVCFGVYFRDAGIIVAPPCVSLQVDYLVAKKLVKVVHCDGTLTYLKQSGDLTLSQGSFASFKKPKQLFIQEREIKVNLFPRRLACGIKTGFEIIEPSNLYIQLPFHNGRLIHDAEKHICGICVFPTPFQCLYLFDFTIGHFKACRNSKLPIYRYIYSSQGELLFAFCDRLLLFRKYYPKNYIQELGYSPVLSSTSEFTGQVVWCDKTTEKITGKLKTFNDFANRPTQPQPLIVRDDSKPEFLCRIPYNRYLHCCKV